MICPNPELNLFDSKITGFDFAITISSCCVSFLHRPLRHGFLRVLLERKWLQENIERLMMLNNRRGLFRSAWVNLSFVNMSASWFMVSTYLICFVEVQIVSVKQPNLAQLCKYGTSAFHDHLDHCFIVFKNAKLGFEMRKLCACDKVVHLG